MKKLLIYFCVYDGKKENPFSSYIIFCNYFNFGLTRNKLEKYTCEPFYIIN